MSLFLVETERRARGNRRLVLVPAIVRFSPSTPAPVPSLPAPNSRRQCHDEEDARPTRHLLFFRGSLKPET